MQHLGPHLLHIEGDVMSLQWNGAFQLEELQELLLLADRILREHGWLFVLIDSSRAGRLDPTARKHVVQWRSPGGTICAAFFGASFTVRVVVNTVGAAAKLLSGKEPMPFHFAETEQAARLWLDAQRQARSRS